MITELTAEQQAKFSVYVDKWTKKGLTTVQRTLDDAKIDFFQFQKHILQKENPLPVVLLDSPHTCWNAVCIASDITTPLDEAAIAKIVDDAKNDRVTNKYKFVWPYFDCQFWASFFAFYDFFQDELGIKYECSKEYEMMKQCQGYGMVFPLDNICIVCQPPTEIHTNASGLHNERGVALSYNGKNEIYALNGVIMQKEYVMTPANEIASDTILKETNVEVRRELLRKVGIERMLDAMPHKLLDSRGNYELYSIQLSEEVKDARYLKMLNPSISTYHLEGVGPECKTIDEALAWRNSNMFIDAEILT